ncbi:MAG: sigma-70 family RNA polymerase sigma factor [Planctomycetes bacterium]|nr:sigma-70 family RNA polymerase sigma factor [Planctomycetota bacterium]
MSQDLDPDIAAALGGTDAEVVGTLVAHHREFLTFLERRVGSRARAEDILQDAFVRGIDRAGSVRSSESAVAWFYRILRNAIVDHARRDAHPARTGGELDPDDVLPADAELEATACACILGIAGTLKPEYAAALRRVDVDGLSVIDFAAEAGITPNNASVRLFRARAALRQRLVAVCRTCADHGCLDCTCDTRSCGSV